jgi:hypothetical protein
MIQSPVGTTIFLLTEVPILALVTTQTAVQWIMRSFRWGLSWPLASIHCRGQNDWSYTSALLYACMTCTGTTLPLPLVCDIVIVLLNSLQKPALSVFYFRTFFKIKKVAKLRPSVWYHARNCPTIQSPAFTFGSSSSATFCPEVYVAYSRHLSTGDNEGMSLCWKPNTEPLACKHEQPGNYLWNLQVPVWAGTPWPS